MRDAFGRLIADPSGLDLAAKVEALQVAVGAGRASRVPELRWLVDGAGRWLAGDAPTIEAALGLEDPGAISRKGIAVRKARALLALAVAVGCDAKALQILRGTAPCPRSAEHLLNAARMLRCPKSANAIGRARAFITKCRSHGDA